MVDKKSVKTKQENRSIFIEEAKMSLNKSIA